MSPRIPAKAALLFLAGMIALPTAQAFARSPKVPMDREALLKKWSALPDLLFLSREQAKDGDAYALLPKLEAEYRSAHRAFQVTTVYRTQEQCKSGEHTFGMHTMVLVNAKGDSLKTTGLIRHEIEKHQADFPEALAAFLRNLPDPAPAAKD